MAIFGIGNTPQPTIVPLDKGTKGLLHQQALEAEQSPEHFAGLLNQGLDKRPLMQTPEQQHSTEAQYGMEPGQFTSIRRAAAKGADSNINSMMRMNQHQGQQMKADYMNKAMQMLLNHQAVETQNHQMITQAYVQQEAARAQMVNQLFQAGTTAYQMNRQKPQQKQLGSEYNIQPAGSRYGLQDITNQNSYSQGSGMHISNGEY